MDQDQILLIDKPAGISSFGVVARVRRVLSEQAGHKVKVGHTGTLDPFATGLLILLTGKMTKKSNEFLKLDKTYEATLKLGYTSTTGDPEGEIRPYQISLQHGEPSLAKVSDSPIFYNASCVVKNNTREYYPSCKEIDKVLGSFVGRVTQKLPEFSAIKINGERAYKLARQGKAVDMPTREVTIYSIELLDYNYPELKIRTHVSSGTYIRTLAEDIGKKLGTGAYLTELRRTEVGDYKIENAKTLEDSGIK